MFCQSIIRAKVHSARTRFVMFEPFVHADHSVVGSSAGWPIAGRDAQHPAPLAIADAEAKTEAEMKPYAELVEHTDAKIEMVPIRGGKFLDGQPRRRERAQGRRRAAARSGDFAVLDGQVRDSLGRLRRLGVGPRYSAAADAGLSGDAPRQAGRRVSAFAADEALHRHDVRHGEAGLSGDLHDAARGPRRSASGSRPRRAATIACRPRPNGSMPAGPGRRRAYSFGDDPAAIGDYAWYYDNSQREVSEGRPEEAQSVGPARHARQRGRVGARSAHEGLLRRSRPAR